MFKILLRKIIKVLLERLPDRLLLDELGSRAISTPSFAKKVLSLNPYKREHKEKVEINKTDPIQEIDDYNYFLSPQFSQYVDFLFRSLAKDSKVLVITSLQDPVQFWLNTKTWSFYSLNIYKSGGDNVFSLQSNDFIQSVEQLPALDAVVVYHPKVSDDLFTDELVGSLITKKLRGDFYFPIFRYGLEDEIKNSYEISDRYWRNKLHNMGLYEVGVIGEDGVVKEKTRVAYNEDGYWHVTDEGVEFNRASEYPVTYFQGSRLPKGNVL